MWNKIFQPLNSINNLLQLHVKRKNSLQYIQILFFSLIAVLWGVDEWWHLFLHNKCWFSCVTYWFIFPQCLFRNTTSRFLDINEIMIVSLKNLNAEPETFQLNCILLDTGVLSTAHCRIFWRGQNVVVIFVIILYRMHYVSSLNDLEVKQHRGTQAHYPFTWVSLC